MPNGSTAWTNVRPGHTIDPWTNFKPGLFSVWNWKTGKYDYYRLNRPLSGYGDEIKHPKPRPVDNPVGESPEQSANALPIGARKFGEGHVAVGEVVSSNGDAAGPKTWVAIALAFAVPTFLLWLTTHLSGSESPEY
jgi:hypothetical protein